MYCLMILTVDGKKSQEKKSRKKSHGKKVTGNKVTGKKVTIIKDQEKIHISVHKCSRACFSCYKKAMIRKCHNQNQIMPLEWETLNG